MLLGYLYVCIWDMLELRESVHGRYRPLFHGIGIVYLCIVNSLVYSETVHPIFFSYFVLKQFSCQ